MRTESVSMNRKPDGKCKIPDHNRKDDDHNQHNHTADHRNQGSNDSSDADCASVSLPLCPACEHPPGNTQNQAEDRGKNIAENVGARGVSEKENKHADDSENKAEDRRAKRCMSAVFLFNLLSRPSLNSHFLSGSACLICGRNILDSISFQERAAFSAEF